MVMVVPLMILAVLSVRSADWFGYRQNRFEHFLGPGVRAPANAHSKPAS